MKRILLFLLIGLWASAINAQKTYVPDDNFEKALIDLGYDYGPLDDYVPTVKISTITSLNISNKNISDLTGIQDFIKLQKLSCELNKLVKINLSQNLSLTYLSVELNMLTSLDLSKNLALKSLLCGRNQISSLDLSNNLELTGLNCESNMLNIINLDNNVFLQGIVCNSNQLTSINLSKNIELISFYCSSNRLTSIDLSNNKKLIQLDCSNNKLTWLNIKNGNNSNMIGQYNRIITTGNPNLRCIQVDYPEFSISNTNWKKDGSTSYSSDCVSFIPKETFTPDDNFEQALIDLGLDEGPLNDYVSTSRITLITHLDLQRKNISDLTGIEDFPKLQYLACSTNKLDSLDLRKNTELMNLFCQDNQLKKLDISKNILLNNLNCERNQLATLDVSKNAAIVQINCGNNLITNLDVSNNLALKNLSCVSNKLKTLNVDKNLALSQLFCSSNQLSFLDVSNNYALNDLYCSSNQLNSLDISKNPILKLINCSSNQLITLNLKNGNNANMTSKSFTGMYATNNPNLTCIQVDNSILSATYSKWNIDTIARYSTNCPIINSDIKPIFDNDSFINIYPNPTSGILSVSSNIKSKSISIGVYDSNGKLIKLITLINQNTNWQSEIDLSDFTKGTYVLKCITNKKLYERKIFKI